MMTKFRDNCLGELGANQVELLEEFQVDVMVKSHVEIDAFDLCNREKVTPMPLKSVESTQKRERGQRRQRLACMTLHYFTFATLLDLHLLPLLIY
jgi:hypothetical protein